MNENLVVSGQVRVAQFGSMPRIVDIAEGMTLASMFERANLQVAPGDLIRVNGQDAVLGSLVNPGDSILVLNKIAGG
jgi:hypothetical protein